MPAGAPTSATGGLSASNSDLAAGPITSSGHQNRHSNRSSDTSTSSSGNSTPVKPLSSSSSSNNNGHGQHHVQLLQPPSQPSPSVGNSNFLAAPSPDAASRRQSSLRSATAVGNLHQQCTRRTLRNINAIRFLRSIKLDGEPNAFTEADEQPNQQAQQLPSQILSETGENENKNTLLLLQKKMSIGLPQNSDLAGGHSPPIPSLFVEMDVESGADSKSGGGIPLQTISVNERDMNICVEEGTRRASSRTSTITPFDVNSQVNNQPVGSFSSSESPTKQSDQLMSCASVNVIPPTPLQPLAGESKLQRIHDPGTEADDDSMPFFASAEDISPTSTRSPRRPSGGYPDYSRYHHNHHQNYYQPYQSGPTKSPPRGSRAETVRINDQVRFKHPRDEDVRFEVGDHDIASKSFRLRHASQRDNSLAGPGPVGSAFGSSFQDEPRESREISFSDLLVVTANALCRSFADSQQQQQHRHQATLLASAMQFGPSAASANRPHPGQGEVEIGLYEYDPGKLDSPTFLQSVNRCPVAMPSYSVTVLGYYDPGSAKKLLNDQFRERFPDIQLTFTKMRSLKREMKKIALKCNLDLWCIAQSYVFFEKLILKHYIKKPNRKMCAGSCLLLSSKMNDIRKTKIPSLIQEIESTFRIDREDLFTTEFNVFLALDFTLMVPDCEVIPHLIRLIEQHHQASGGSFGFSSSTSSAALQHCSPSNYALLQQHMQQHVHVRPPATTTPTSALQTNSSNGGNSSTAVVLSFNFPSVIAKSYNNNNNVTN